MDKKDQYLVSDIPPKGWEDIDEAERFRKRIQRGQETIEYSEILADAPTKERPLIVVPGVTETSTTFLPLMWRMSQNGRNTMCIQNAHGIQAPQSRKYSHPQRRKAEALLELIKQTGISQTDVVAHSEGAITSAIAADIAPEHFRNLVLINPSGLVQNDNPAAMISRFVTEGMRHILQGLKAVNNETHRRIAQLGGQGAWDYITSGPWATVKEGWATAEADIHDLMKRIQQKGVKVAVISTEDDLLYPIHRSPDRLSRTSGIPKKHIHSFRGVHVLNLEDHHEVPVLIEKAIDGLNADRALGKV